MTNDEKILGTFTPSTFDGMVELAAAGHRAIAPVYLKEKTTNLLGIYGSHGFYRKGIHADGRLAVLFVVDPHHLDPVTHKDEKFRKTYAPGYYLDPKNVPYIEVIAGRGKRTNKNWPIEAINHHNHLLNEMKSEYGHLNKVTGNFWFSGAVIYELKPADPKKVPRSTRKKYGKDTPLFEICCYTTAGKNHPFGEISEEILKNNRMPWLLTVGARRAFVTREEVDAIVADDAMKRIGRVMRCKDPDIPDPEYDRAGRDDNPLTIKRRTIKNRLSHFTIRFIQAGYVTLRTLNAQRAAIGLGKTIILSLLQLGLKGVRAFFGQYVVDAVRPILMAQKKAEMGLRRSEDIAFTLTRPENPNDTRLDPQQAPFIRLLEFEESRIMPQGALLKSQMQEDWAEDYILDTYDSPPGSIMQNRRIGNMDVLHVEQSNGLEVYYLVGKSTAYARFRTDLVQPAADPLPEKVKDLLKSDFVKVWEDSNGELQHAAQTAAEFKADIARETDVTQKLEYLPPPAHDMSALNEFNARANRDRIAAEQSPLRRAFRLAGGVVRGIVGMGPRQDRQYFIQKTLKNRLEDREQVAAAPTAPEHPASNTGQERLEF